MSKGRRVLVAGLWALLSAGILTALIVSVHGPGASPLARAAAPPPPELLPAVWHEAPRAVADVAWTDADGRPVRPAHFAGKPLLLNLWATWCAPCVREMPMLDALAGMTAGAVSVVVLNQDRDRAAARRYWDERGFANLAFHLDPGLAAFSGFGVRGLPLTLIVDAEGREIGRMEGIAEWTAPEVVEWLTALAPGTGGSG